jgi:uncharacterized membrane protein (UPF0182 family)
VFPPRIVSSRARRSPPRILQLLIAAFLLLIMGRWLASFVIEYQWWQELGQLETWFSVYLYGVAPVAVATLISAVVLLLAHRYALHFAETKLRDHRLYGWIMTAVLLLLAFLIASATLDSWTVVRYAGSRALAEIPGSFHDAVFGKPLSFYLFDLPFYQDLRSFVLGLIIAAIVVYWLSARAWQLRYRLPDLRNMERLDLSVLRLSGGLESGFLRGALAVMLLAFAVKFFLGRYEMVHNEHGFMTGIDYVDANITLPLQWLLVAASVAAAALVASGRWILAGIMILAVPVEFLVPKLVSSLYVKPNEISLERSYIDTHIHATRSAYGLEQRVKEVEFQTRPAESIDTVVHKPLLDNVRLWDWRPFHDTVTQQQALRTYYVFNEPDLDRYMIDGQLRQVLLAARELDIRQLPDAQASWINPHFIYTHGYGLALAEVSKITPEGRPVYLVENMPPEVHTSSLKVTQPEIYYGEVMHEPVFVRTAQEEFNYPSGNDNVKSRYNGRGGFPVSSLPMRIAAAVHEGDLNILLTQYLTPESRMMIRRKVTDRLQELAGFLNWDGDPYLVITPEGRLVWMLDGYTTSNAHPYSKTLTIERFGSFNYIRNSVKATVDAYDGDTKIYIFDPSDPLIRAYQKLFPQLFHPRSEMPAGLLAHTRYPEILFNVQAEIYRAYHMTNPQAFYNKEDLWDLAQYVAGQNGQPQPVTPTYVVATLPGDKKPEFMLMTSFTPRTKQNLIGVLAARCDGEHLGELELLELSKQQLIPGPMQIAASINQDQNISKDLTLWNQQGSTVLRGQMLVLPVDNTFLYVEPIYLQATEARMPQLKKVVLGIGNRLIYTDTYEQAIAQLGAGSAGALLDAAAQSFGKITSVPAAAAPATSDGGRLDTIRRHLQRYRELQGQGKFSEAGRELEALEGELKK